ncbi:MAG: hypothetical protein RSD02_12460, partial [Niameybacter sp.]
DTTLMDFFIIRTLFQWPRLDQAALLPYDLATIADKYILKLDEEVLAARGIDTSLQNAAVAFSKEADKLYTQSLQIKALYDQAQAKGKDLKLINEQLMTYNEAMRKVSETVIRGTQYVGLDQVLTQTEYYQNLPGIYEEAILSLKAGDGKTMLEDFDIDSDERGQYAQGYMEYMEYPVWINAYRECFEPESKSYKFNWVENILLKYYDIYQPLMSIQDKVEAGDTDFTYEIEALATVKNDVQRRLELACEEDTAMWEKAMTQLPVALSTTLIQTLNQLMQ